MAEKIEDFIPWRGNVESKIRKLVKNIESQP
jgi:poly(A) polymerase Pap1